MACQMCGLDAPTQHVSFHQNIGMLFARSYSHVTGDLCRKCIRKSFKSCTLTTLFLGWWGVISFIVTPFMLLGNLYSYMRTLSLPEPDFAAMNSPLVTSGVVIGTGRSFKFKLIYGTVVWAIVLFVVLQNAPQVIDKYAPKLNAYLHSGAPTSDADMDYRIAHFSEAFTSYKALMDSACPEKASFKDCRTKILAARPVLDQMGNHYRALLTAWAERSVPDSCSVPMDQYFSAIGGYWTVEDNALRLFASVNPDSQDSVRAALPQLQEIQVQEGTATEQLAARAEKVNSKSGSPCKD